MKFYGLFLLAFVIPAFMLGGNNPVSCAVNKCLECTEAADLVAHFSLANPTQFLFVPGDHVPLVVSLFNEGTDTIDNLEVSVSTPTGSKANDSFWRNQGENALRTVARLAPNERLLLSVQVTISPDFVGTTLSFTAAMNGENIPQTVQVEVAKIVSTRLDTCAYVRDSTETGINAFVSTRTLIKAQLREPVDLSARGPIRVSPKSCAVFKMKPLVINKKAKKDKCSCLTFEFNGPTGRNYPEVDRSDGEQLRGCRQTISGSRAGDTISISVSTLNQLPLRGILLTKGNGELIEAVLDGSSLNYEYVLTEDTASFKLYLRAKRRFLIFTMKQFAQVEVKRKPIAIEYIKSMGEPYIADNLSTKILSSGQIGTDGKNSIHSETVVKKTPAGSIFLVVNKTVDSSGFVLQRDTITSDTCLGSYAYQQIESKRAVRTWVTVDTLLSTVIEEEYLVGGKRNIMARRRGFAEVKIPVELNVADFPAKDSLVSLAYWIGIGEGPIAEYASLVEDTPEEWSQPGVTAPLAALCLDYPIVLPVLPVGNARFQQEVVRYDFIPPGSTSSFSAGKKYPALIKRQDARPNYGIISGQALSKLRESMVFDPELGKYVLRFLFAYSGEHEVNSYRIQLKLVGCYRVSEPRKIWQSTIPELR